jgi:Protein of unknown function (DUF3500)
MHHYDHEGSNKNGTRREFLISASGAVAAATAVSLGVSGTQQVQAAPKIANPESPVDRFYDSLSATQKTIVCLPADSRLRNRISANWKVTKPSIGDDFYSNEQRVLIHDIVKHVTSEDGYERLIRQMDDDIGGIEYFHIGTFGEPGSDDFQWMLTGRHLTLRADGSHKDNVAFGGPLVYGHGEESAPEDNLYYYQTKQVNEVFKALDVDQAKQALLTRAPKESDIRIQGAEGDFAGTPVSDFSDDQKQLVAKTLETLLSPYRTEDVDEAMAILTKGGGLDSLRMAFYQKGDLKNDKIWDIWRVEGPSMVWNFRGSRHVHAYINIGVRSQS